MNTNKKVVKILIDLEFNGSMNSFEEFYGETVSYQEIEQESYIDFKNMLQDFLGKIKLRKAREISKPNSLTCRLVINNNQYELFKSIYERKEIDKELSTEENIIYKKFNFLHNFRINNLRTE